MTAITTPDTTDQADRSSGGFWQASPEARLMWRPFRAYAALAAGRDDDVPTWLLWLRRPMRLLAFLGVFVALTAAGRLVLWHVLLAALFWAFGPLYQTGAAALAIRLFKRDAPLARSVDLFYMGHGPWYALLFGLVAVCFAAPEVYEAFSFLLRSGVLPGLALLTIVYAAVLTYAFFRAGLGLSRGRSWAALGTYYGAVLGALLLWYLLTGQLLPAIHGSGGSA